MKLKKWLASGHKGMKFSALLLCVAMAFGLMACGSSSSSSSSSSATEKEEVQEAEAEEEAEEEIEEEEVAEEEIEEEEVAEEEIKEADAAEEEEEEEENEIVEEAAAEGTASTDWPENPDTVYTLTFGVTITQDTPSGEALLAINEELKNRSNGAVELDIFWDSTLGGATELAEGVATGTTDMTLVSSAVISNYTPAIDVFSLPFIISDRDQVLAVIDAYFDDVTAGMEESIGIPLGIWELGYRHLCTVDKEVKTLEDLEGMTIRVMDGQIYSATFNALGCIPTNVDTSELVTALQQGVVDGVEEPFSMICGQQQYEFCDYVAMIGYNYSIGVPVLSVKTAESLPEEVLELVEDVFYDYRYYTIEAGQRFEDDYIAICEENGMVINYLDDSELARFQDAVAPIWEEYADSIGQDLIDKVANITY